MEKCPFSKSKKRKAQSALKARGLEGRPTQKAIWMAQNREQILRFEGPARQGGKETGNAASLLRRRRCCKAKGDKINCNLFLCFVWAAKTAVVLRSSLPTFQTVGVGLGVAAYGKAEQLETLWSSSTSNIWVWTIALGTHRQRSRGGYPWHG